MSARDWPGDEASALMTQCKEGSQRDGLMLDSNEELYKWFTSQVSRLALRADARKSTTVATVL